MGKAMAKQHPPTQRATIKLTRIDLVQLLAMTVLHQNLTRSLQNYGKHTVNRGETEVPNKKFMSTLSGLAPEKIKHATDATHVLHRARTKLLLITNHFFHKVFPYGFRNLEGAS